MTNIPVELRYTAEHEWIRTPGETPGSIRVGITEYAQDQLGDIVYVSLPSVGDVLTAGSSCGELESTKSVSDLYSPASGTVTLVNDALVDAPDLLNTDPYGAGWLLEISPDGPISNDLDASGYRAHIGE